MSSQLRRVVLDTNIIMDTQKEENAQDVPNASVEIPAAREIGARLLENRLVLVYSDKMKHEWIIKRLLESNSLLRDLFRFEMVEKVEPLMVKRGKKNELGPFVAHDDQAFVFAAAALVGSKKYLLTRDPRSTQKNARAYVKKEYKVLIRLASEYCEDDSG